MSPGDLNIVANLRFRWRKVLERFNDAQLLAIYDDFALSEQFGQNDKYFIEFVQQCYPTSKEDVP